MRVFFLILDAFDPGRLSPRLTPNLWRWANADGAVAGTGISVMASSTYPNHATFITGVQPQVHGIHLNHVISDEIRGAWETGPGVATLFDRVADLETEAVLGDHHLVGVMGAAAATRHWPPGGDISKVGQLDPLGYPDDDEVLPRLLAALDTEAEFVVGYFGSIDTYSHIFGPDSTEAIEAYRRLDARIGPIDQMLRSGWEETVLAVVSDHVQDTVDGPGIDLRSHLPDEVVTVEEGSAALVAGLGDASILDRIDGVEGWELVSSGAVLTWCGRGRYFGPFAEPFFRGTHGGAHTRTQLALVSGGHPARREMASAVAGGPVPAAYWAPALARAMGRAALPDAG